MKTKKFISILLVIMLACTLIPISVAASDITFTALDGTQSSTELGYAKLFDGKNTTGNYTKWSDSFNADKSSYVVFAASEAVFIDAYTFVTADNALSYPKRTPKSWVLYGCNDYNTTKKSATWREIDSVTDDTTITNKNCTSYRFEIENIRKKYKYYKLCITANGGDELMQLCGLKLSVFDGNVTFSALAGTAGVNSSENYDKLVDGKKTESDSTKWGVSNFSNAYIVIEASNRIVLNGYTFTTGNDNASATGRNPKDWTLYGCNDYNTANNSGTWTVISEVTNDTVMKDENYTSYSYDVDSNTKYKYFKLEITANQGNSFMQLGEIEFSWDDVKEEEKRIMFLLPHLSALKIQKQAKITINSLTEQQPQNGAIRLISRRT